MSVNIKQNGELVKVAGLYKKTVPIGIAEKYSTEERQVGVWTDGKPLYQTTIKVPASSLTSSETVISHELTDVDYICAIEGIALKTGNGSTPLLTYHSSSAWACGVYNASRTSFTFYVGSSLKSYITELEVTLKYTKTTDTAGTGIYAPDEATLPMLGDVNINNPVDGQAMVYNGTTKKWENGNGIEDLSSLIINPLEADVSRLTLKRTGHVYVLQGHMQFSAAVSDNTDILILPVTINPLQIWQFAHNRTANNWASLFINDKTIRTRYALLADAILSFDMVFLA